MPNGVICGGAVEGSNQLGETVTCHAMTARPEGSAAPAMDTIADKATTATKDKRANARGRYRICNEVIGPSTRKVSRNENGAGVHQSMVDHIAASITDIQLADCMRPTGPLMNGVAGAEISDAQPANATNA